MGWGLAGTGKSSAAAATAVVVVVVAPGGGGVKMEITKSGWFS